jgi:hypothetical protein
MHQREVLGRTLYPNSCREQLAIEAFCRSLEELSSISSGN